MRSAKHHVQMSESYLLACLLALAGGFLDGYTYLCRNHVFANTQTGNVCLLGFALAEGRLIQAGRCLVPLLAFVLGTLLAEGLRRRLPARPLHWRQGVLVLEMLLLVCAALLPAAPLANSAANLLISFACALQCHAFRKFEDCPYASTMCTGNLRSASEQLYRLFAGGGTDARRKSLQYFGIDLLFAGGVMLGA